MEEENWRGMRKPVGGRKRKKGRDGRKVAKT